ncbi:aminotransferase class I/II-fold pyridoxal phosphate-dependent enzyme [Streptomyces tricolor]|nr:aminotransferase class I/II-fold pyridoxal phosphate-dependent enzyme [Streptomyces tricolor]
MRPWTAGAGPGTGAADGRREIGLPVLPSCAGGSPPPRTANAYGPVPGSQALRASAAGYWERRGLATDPGLVVAGPGSKPLLFALLLAVGGDVVVPVPSWVSYAAQARLVGAHPVPVPTAAGQGGVPDPRGCARPSRGAGRRQGPPVRGGDPAGQPDRHRRLARHGAPPGRPGPGTRPRHRSPTRSTTTSSTTPRCSPSPPARHALERTVVTTGLTKNLAVGGWRTGVARLPNSGIGRALHGRLVSVATARSGRARRRRCRPPPPTRSASHRRSPSASRPAAGCTRSWCARWLAGSPPRARGSLRSARPATSTRTSGRSGTTWPRATACTAARTWSVPR